MEVVLFVSPNGLDACYVRVSFYGGEYSTPTKATILYFPVTSAEDEGEESSLSSFMEVMQSATIVRYISNYYGFHFIGRYFHDLYGISIVSKFY